MMPYNKGLHIEKGYTEIEVAPIVKEACFFEEWDKNILTPVSGLLSIMILMITWLLLLILVTAHAMNGQ